MRKHCLRSSLTILLVLGLIVVCHGHAESAGITVDFSGSLVSAGTPFSVGEGFSGSYTFDSTVAPTSLVPGNNEEFHPLTALTVTLGSYTASFSSATPAGGLLLTHNVSSTDASGKSFTADGYQVNVTAGAGLSAPPVNGLPLFTINLGLLDPTHNAFSTFPSTPPTPQFCALSCQFTDSNFNMGWSTGVEGGSSLFIIGAINSLTVQTPVPEPATWLLLGSGLASLVLWRKRQRPERATGGGVTTRRAGRGLGILVLTAILVSAAAPGIAQATTVNGVSFSGPGLGVPAPSATFGGTTVGYQMTFGSVAPIDMTVSLTGAGAVTIFFSTFPVDTVFNQTGITWADYHFLLGTGSGSGFTPSTSADGLGFALSPPPASDIFTILSQHEDTLDWTGGVVPSGGPGVNFSFAVNVASGSNSFTVREVPSVPEPSTWLLLGTGVVALAFAGRRLAT